MGWLERASLPFKLTDIKGRADIGINGTIARFLVCTSKAWTQRFS